MKNALGRLWLKSEWRGSKRKWSKGKVIEVLQSRKIDELWEGLRSVVWSELAKAESERVA